MRLGPFVLLGSFAVISAAHGAQRRPTWSHAHAARATADECKARCMNAQLIVSGHLMGCACLKTHTSKRRIMGVCGSKATRGRALKSEPGGGGCGGHPAMTVSGRPGSPVRVLQLCVRLGGGSLGVMINAQTGTCTVENTRPGTATGPGFDAG